MEKKEQEINYSVQACVKTVSYKKRLVMLLFAIAIAVDAFFSGQLSWTTVKTELIIV